MKDVLDYIAENQEAFVADLIDFLKIPSVSTQPEHAQDMVQAAAQLQARLEALGLEARQFTTERHPMVYAEWSGAPEAPTVLFYGHYDVQPPEPLDLWKSKPFEPRIQGDKIYARGASDDKGQLFTHLKGIEAFMKTREKLPVNVKLIIEGEEEIGSPNLVPFVQSHRELLACDCVVISDTEMWAEGVPALSYGLRGLLGAQIELRGPNRDLHSGLYGGAVPNPLNQLARLIALLHDADGRVTIPGFYDDVREVEPWEREAYAQLGLDEKAYRDSLGLKALWGEKGYSVLERVWARPTLDVNGMWGGYQGPGGKTIIPSVAYAKITMRIVPDQNPKKIAQSFREYLHSLCPESVELTIEGGEGSPGLLLPTEGPVVDSARRALAQAFGREPAMIRMGGSIPVVATFAKALEAPCLLLGFGLPDDNLHSPNEKFNLDCFHGGIKTTAHFMNELGRKDSANE